MQTTEIDTFFYIFLIITILLLLLTILIIGRSRSRVNQLFIITPILFSSILIFNMVEYFGTVPDFILWLPYLLAPLGMLLAGWYIHYGSEMIYVRKNVIFSSIYILLSVILSAYLEYQPVDDPNVIAFCHFILVIPLLAGANEYFKIRLLVPEQRRKIITLVIGLLIVVVGTLIRGANYYINGEDLVPGLIVIVVGTFIILISFLLQTHQNKSTS